MGDTAINYEELGFGFHTYVIADRIIASNYFNYYKAFARLGIIDLHEGSVS